jgi:hypothetical protein
MSVVVAYSNVPTPMQAFRRSGLGVLMAKADSAASGC